MKSFHDIKYILEEKNHEQFSSFRSVIFFKKRDFM